MNNKIYAIYARNPDGSDDLISEKFAESWVPSEELGNENNCQRPDL